MKVVFSDVLGDRGVKIAAVPTHTEMMKIMWEELRPYWATRNQDGKLWAVHHTIEPVLFEQIWYGTEWVVEAEGVIVERVARK